MTDFCEKPIDINSLSSVIAKWLPRANEHEATLLGQVDTPNPFEHQTLKNSLETFGEDFVDSLAAATLQTINDQMAILKNPIAHETDEIYTGGTHVEGCSRSNDWWKIFIRKKSKIVQTGDPMEKQ